MFVSEVKIRVRYAETDRMGYVFYGNYAVYFDVARVEALRELGFIYKEVEDNGIILPVYTFTIKYLKPAFYDDVLTIKTYIKQIPKARLMVYHETFNEQKEMINSGETTLVFIDVKTNKPRRAPQNFIDEIRKYVPFSPKGE